MALSSVCNIVVIAVDDSEFSEKAFDRKFKIIIVTYINESSVEGNNSCFYVSYLIGFSSMLTCR